MTYPG